VRSGSLIVGCIAVLSIGTATSYQFGIMGIKPDRIRVWGSKTQDSNNKMQKPPSKLHGGENKKQFYPQMQVKRFFNL
jgi:hypothetical protein